MRWRLIYRIAFFFSHHLLPNRNHLKTFRVPLLNQKRPSSPRLPYPNFLSSLACWIAGKYDQFQIKQHFAHSFPYNSSSMFSSNMPSKIVGLNKFLSAIFAFERLIVRSKVCSQFESFSGASAAFVAFERF